MKKIGLTVFCIAFIGIGHLLAGKKPISENLFGIFFEDLNYAADGGLYAEMVQNRSFEYSPSDIDKRRNRQNNWHYFTAWGMERDNSICTISLESTDPIHPNNPHYLVFDALTAGPDGVGLSNGGYDGMVVRKDSIYDFSAFMRVLDGGGVPVKIQLRNEHNDSILSDMEIYVGSADWTRYETILKPTADCDSAALYLMFQSPAKVALDMVSLFPRATFRGRSNGLRADIAQTIADLKPSFVRFPGGCLAHGDGLANIYNWKNTIGPVEYRKADKNIWNYSQSFGLGYFEYLQYCEDIGAKPIPVIAAGVSCQNSARRGGTGQEAVPLEQMDSYIQDILDLIEYCNGPASSEWGAKRAEAGHPDPFNLEYIGIGNEDKITPEFEERFEMIVKAVKSKYPDIKIVGTSGPNSEGEDFEKGWASAKNCRIEVVDEHYYKKPEWFLENLSRYDSYSRKDPKVYLGEYASWGNTLYNALAEAAYMTSLERNGDVVEFASYAPLLARIGHTQWNPDMIYFDGKSVYPTVNYQVQRLFSNNQGSQYVDGVFGSEKDSGPRTASCVIDKESGDIILKMVNPTDEVLAFNVDLRSLGRFSPDAWLTTLSGSKDDKNTPEMPDKVMPKTSGIKVAKKFVHELSPYSMAVIRIAAR